MSGLVNWFRNLKWGLLLLAVIGSGASVFFIFESAHEVATIRTLLDAHSAKFVSDPSQARPGEIVIVSGTLYGDPPPQVSGFGWAANTFRVSIEIARQKGWKRKWRRESEHNYYSENAHIGAWRISPPVLRTLSENGQTIVPDRIAPIPGATNITAGRTDIAFEQDGVPKRMTHMVWPMGKTYTVLGEVLNGGNAIGTLVDPRYGADFALMYPGRFTGDSFLPNVAKSKAKRAVRFYCLLLICLWIVLSFAARRFEHLPFASATLVGTWRSLVVAAPLLILFAWPASLDDFSVVAAATAGLTMAMLFGLCFWIFYRREPEPKYVRGRRSAITRT